MKTIKLYITIILGVTILWGCKDANSDLRYACKNGNIVEVKKIIESGNIDINQGAIHHGPTPLMMASSKGKIDVVQLLLEKGANPNICDGVGDSALLYAISKGDDSIVKLLLDNGADVNVISQFGYTPLILASTLSHFNIVKLLLEYGANVNLIDADEKTALDDALSSKSPEIINLLREHGAKTGRELKREKKASEKISKPLENNPK